MNQPAMSPEVEAWIEAEVERRVTAEIDSIRLYAEDAIERRVHAEMSAMCQAMGIQYERVVHMPPLN